MSNCEKCKKATDSRERTTIRCFGRCRKLYHYACVDWNFEKFGKLFKECPYARFVCLECQGYEEDTLYEEFNKINLFIMEMKQHLTANHLKIGHELEEIKSQVEEIQKPTEQPHSFAAVVKSNPTKLVMLQPKQPQANKKIRKDLTTSPKNIPVMGCRNIANGGIILQCNTNDAKEKLKTIVTEKMGADYEVKLPTELKPRVKILGMSEKLESDEIVSALKQQNHFLANSDIKVITTYCRRNSQKIDTIIEVGSVDFTKILQAEKLNIHFDRCHVVESVGISRCFNCNGYGHHSNRCTGKLCCPRCSENHKLGECKSQEVKCSNCIAVNTKLNLNVAINHTTWDTSCAVYQRKMKTLKNQISYQ